MLDVQNYLISIQPQFKANLRDGVHRFKIRVAEFVVAYDDRYLLVTGC